MDVLNICSAIGNIGDDASHIGLKNILDKLFPVYSISKLDIRDFYRSEPAERRRVFDLDLAKHINKFDLCIIGGGAYLDYPIVGSTNGPTIDFKQEFLENLDTKTIISSVSCRPMEHNETYKLVMDEYLTKLQKHPKIELLLRNDGSVKHLASVGISNFSIEEILDHGFFIEPKDLEGPDSFIGESYCCINIVEDQLSFYGNEKIFTEDFYHRYMAGIISAAVSYGFEKIILVPHIFKDLNAIAKVLKFVDRKIISNRIIVKELSQGEESAKKTFGIYYNSELNIGTRFHTNVCSFALDKPTIPIAFTGRVKALCADLGIEYQFEEILDDFSGAYKKSTKINQPHVSSVLSLKKISTVDILSKKVNGIF